AAPWMPIGGEGRVAAVSVRSGLDLTPRMEWPPPGGRFLTYLATPGLFTQGRWFPEHLAAKCNLVAAITASPRVFSGWNVPANRPLLTRYAVPAGAVHFWQIRDEVPEDPHGESISEEQEDRQAGWGLALRGEWEYV
ncbi:MAG: type III-B CRISPR module-associated Cmr3 family protein, partial [Armatimonadota bacterium]|nr:type III-B CRISPR module-associated Cmr3 family protein [Armatimonadota bacterium]